MSESIKPTPGPWTYLEGTTDCEKVIGGDGKVVADGWWCREVSEVDANSRLIAEAGTVHHETGLTPRQLVEQRDALATALAVCESALAWAIEQGGGPACEHEAGVCFCRENEAVNAARAALGLVKGSTP